MTAIEATVPHSKTRKQPARKAELAASTAAPVTIAQADIIPYDVAVSEGKEIVAKIEVAERGQLRLGELADRLEPKYGDRTLANLLRSLASRSARLIVIGLCIGHGRENWPQGQIWSLMQSCES